jgi:hypothetical protein
MYNPFVHAMVDDPDPTCREPRREHPVHYWADAHESAIDCEPERFPGLGSRGITRMEISWW